MIHYIPALLILHYNLVSTYVATYVHIVLVDSVKYFVVAQLLNIPKVVSTSQRTP